MYIKKGTIYCLFVYIIIRSILQRIDIYNSLKVDSEKRYCDYQLVIF